MAEISNNNHNNNEILYIFLDEGGNLDFSKNGTSYFSLTSLTTIRNWDNIHEALSIERYKLLESDYKINEEEYFHACEDNNYIRSKIFDLINKNIKANDKTKLDSVIVEKRKTIPHLQDIKHFYPKILDYLIKHIIKNTDLQEINKIIVITDKLPLSKKRKTVEKSIKQNLAEALKPIGIKYRIFHHSSKTHFGLQIADYCNWAILRKWERKEDLYYNKIKDLIKSEFDIFEWEKDFYY